MSTDMPARDADPQAQCVECGERRGTDPFCMTCGVEHEDAADVSGPGDLPQVIAWRNAVLAQPVACGQCRKPSCTASMPALRRWVLTALSLYASLDGSRIYPSTVQLARNAGLSRYRTEEHLRAAIRAGWLTRYSRGRGAKGWTRYGYRLAVPTVPAACDTPRVVDDAGPADDTQRVEGPQLDDTNRVKRDHVDDTLRGELRHSLVSLESMESPVTTSSGEEPSVRVGAGTREGLADDTLRAMQTPHLDSTASTPQTTPDSTPPARDTDADSKPAPTPASAPNTDDEPAGTDIWEDY